MKASPTHLVLLPTYNTGPRLRTVVAEVLGQWPHVLVVVDGSTDGSADRLQELAALNRALTVLVLPVNVGKGAAVLAGAEAAQARGFTHALVMDADGQHPAASIAEFMHASRRRPAALILGRPVFPANTPVERRHGRKLSIGLVHLELLSTAVSDPLFGFRVYPLAPLLAVLGPRRGGRRYDFDTEAAVRLGWAGLPARNLAAPVRYFSRAEGGVSHFHYLRDNLLLIWLHTRLLAELLFWRWPAVVRRRWQGTAVALVLLLLGPPAGGAREFDPTAWAGPRLAPADPAWCDLTVAFATQADTAATFVERRIFPFRKEPVELAGVVRVSAERGLSLHYTAPEARTVILDDRGMLIRGPAGEQPAPADPRAAAAHETMRRIVRFDLSGLEADFDIHGQRDGPGWKLALLPRTAAARQGIGRITVNGERATIRRIELRRSARQVVEILIAPPRPGAPFTAEEMKAYFR